MDQRPTTCGVQILGQDRDLGILEVCLRTAFLKMNVFK